MRNASPLRYPGGKWRIAPFFQRLIQLNGLSGWRYVEPYAGGASLALSLLFQGHVSEIVINDLDPAIYAFWSAVLNRNRDLCDLVRATPVTSDEWIHQREVYNRGLSAGVLAFGFATFFLNRTNHSGILNGGMIGGKEQSGSWKINARYNKQELLRRIRLVASHKSRIHLFGIDAVELLLNIGTSRDVFVYLDPPYYRAGRALYFNAYKPTDHAVVRKSVRQLRAPWVVSYDDVREIRELYPKVKCRRVELLHTARDLRLGREVLFFSSKLRIPVVR